MEQAQRLLQEIGIEGERVQMFNLGASDAVKFAAACDRMADTAKRLGPSPLRRNSRK